MLNSFTLRSRLIKSTNFIKVELINRTLVRMKRYNLFNEEMIRMIVLNFNEEACFLSNIVGCTHAQALEYVELEDSYFDKNGLNVYEPTDETDLVSDLVVEEEEMDKYILENSKMLTKDLIEKLNDAEMRYFRKIGIVQ